MKLLIVLCMVAIAVAEPPRFRPARFRFQRQELAPTTTESTAESTTADAANAPYPAAGGPYPPSGWKPEGQAFTLPQKSAPENSYGAPDNAPYPPSGWKPQGQAFTLPARQEAPQPPATSYGVPDNSYGPPDNTYGPPDNTYGPPDNTYGAPTTDATEAASTDNPQAERLEGTLEIQKSVGSYYVLLPNGELQRVEFATKNDVQNLAYTSRLQGRERAPLFLLRA